MRTLSRPPSSPRHSRPIRPHRSGAMPTPRAAAPVLVEYRVITGEPAYLEALGRAFRKRVEDHIGHVGEVQFHDEGDRIHLVHLWHGPIELRTFIEQAHVDLLAYRRDAGAFPTVERTLWWSTVGTEVTLAEAADRAAHLREYGPRPRAFTLTSPVPTPA